MLGAVLALVLHAFLLPLQALRFWWGRRHEVLVQSIPGWVWDQALALGVRILLFTALGAAVAVLVARLPRTWWLALGALVAALSVVLVALTPHLVRPLFERTEPLADPRLRAEVLALADRAGVGAGDVRVSDASARTTAANARVEGLGAGRRIVLYDTLLDGFPPAQVRTVVAHELAHVQAGHIVKGTAWAAGLALPACLVLFGIVGSRTGFGAPARGQAGCELVVRRTTIIAVCAAMLGLVSLPLQNAVSRSFEREADVLALELTGDPAAAIALQQGPVRRARAVPDPPPVIVWLLATHPPALERIGIALARKNGSSWHDER
jgi:STE24 endopeptidase